MSTTSEKLGVVIVSTWYPHDNRPNFGIFVQQQAQALSRVHNVTVIGAEWLNLNQIKKLCADPVDEAGVLVYRHRWWHVPVIWPILWLGSFFLCSLRIDWQSVDLIHIHTSLPGGFAAALLKQWVHKPLILTEHIGKFSYFMESWGKELATRYAYRHADRVITVSKMLANSLKEYHLLDHRHVVLPNMVDLQRFSRNGKSQDTGDLVQILWIGRFMPGDDKGAELLLGATQAISQKIDATFHLTLVGGGERLEYFQQMSQDMGINSLCTFTGEVPSDQIPTLVQSCSFLVSSSYRESFGVILLEAMACGKPVIATRCGGPEEVVNQDVGILIDVGNVTALEAAMMQMISKYKSYNPDTIIEYVTQKYSAETIVNRLTNLYRQALETYG